MAVSKNPSDETHEKFNGIDFKRWRQKMLFYLTTMNLANIVKEDVPKPDKEPPSKESLMTIEAWTQSDFLCRNYILNRLENNLYDIYSSYKTAKQVWEMLELNIKLKMLVPKRWLIQRLW